MKQMNRKRVVLLLFPPLPLPSRRMWPLSNYFTSLRHFHSHFQPLFWRSWTTNRVPADERVLARATIEPAILYLCWQFECIMCLLPRRSTCLFLCPSPARPDRKTIAQIVNDISTTGNYLLARWTVKDGDDTRGVYKRNAAVGVRPSSWRNPFLLLINYRRRMGNTRRGSGGLGERG